jgi:murein DD-endopeptidase MepM/ murein hydrolase activator NlpD
MERRPVLGLIGAISVLAFSVSAAAQSSWVRPVNASPSAGYFDPSYTASENRQHLGVDLPAARNTPVRSPIEGTVVLNRTGARDIMQAYLVIRDTGSGHEHVLGHISSALNKGDPVARGQVVGQVRDWGTNSHVHWGINKVSVASAMGFTDEGEWGWGRAPTAVTARQAASRGWIDAWNSGASTASPPRGVASPGSNSTSGSPATAGIPAKPRNTLPGKPDEPGARMTGSSVTINWSTVRGATEYDLSVRDVTDKKSLSIDRVARAFHIVRVKSGHTYRWSVKACNAAGCSEASERLYFTVQ